MSEEIFAPRLSLPVLHTSTGRAVGQQLFRQTAKPHVDHIAGRLKRLAARWTASGFCKTRGGKKASSHNVISVHTSAKIQHWLRCVKSSEQSGAPQGSLRGLQKVFR